MSSIQDAPRLGNPFHNDRVLRSWLRRQLSPRDLPEWERELGEFGSLIEQQLYPQQLAELPLEAGLQPFDAQGQRVDRILLTPLWQRLQTVAAEHGLVACGYEREPQARLRQFALVYLLAASSDFYCCPLALSDGMARVLLESGNDRLVARVLPRLFSRDPDHAWTAAQWLSGTRDSSEPQDVLAHMDDSGQWRLRGQNVYTVAASAQVAVVLARPENAPPGPDGLALFLAEPRDSAGMLQGVCVEGLKHKLGTHKLPTAELLLDGVPVEPVGALSHGLRTLAPMQDITRVWSAITALSLLRRGLQLAREHGERRLLQGRPLLEQAALQQSLADAQARFEAAFHLGFLAVDLLGRHEQTGLDEQHQLLLQLLMPLARLLAVRQSSAGLGEVLEAMGGLGCLDSSGLPALLRDAQVLGIWDGGNDVLAQDVLRLLARTGLAPLQAHVRARLASVNSGPLATAAEQIKRAWAQLEQHVGEVFRTQREGWFGQARAVALSLARILAAAELLRHADWAGRAEADPRPLAAARRFVQLGLLEPAGCANEDRRMLGTDRHPGH